MPSSKQQLQETLKSLESYELPQNVQSAISTSGNATIDPALIERYKEARALFLRRRVQQIFLEHVTTFDGETFELPQAPTAEEQEAQKEELNQLCEQVKENVHSSHQQILELQYKYKTFCSRREELKNMVRDMEDNDNGSNNNNKSSGESMDVDGETEENDDDDVDDEALAAEEDRLAELQEKKARLQMQLNDVRQKTRQLALETEKMDKEVEEMSGGKPPVSPTSIQTETSETERQLAKLDEMKNFYDELRDVLEELSSIKILSVDRGTTESVGVGAERAARSSSNSLPKIQMHVRLMDDHEILIVLQADPEKPKVLRLKSAKFLTSTVVKAPKNENKDDDDGREAIQMTIPPLDDLVKLCACYPPVEELRFLIRETMARIRMIKSRVVELGLLDGFVLTQIGTYYKTTEENFGGEEQEVVCSLPECITVVLRLTADFPMIPGSVRIWQMVGVAGWNDKDVDNIKERVSRKEFSSATELIEEVQAEIARMRKDENLTLPKTPMLPLRRKKD